MLRNILVLFVLACVLGAGFSVYYFADQQEAASAEQIQVAKAMNQFSFDLYHEMSQGTQQENLVFSPISLFSALTMVMDGARGETADQMGKALRLPPEIRTTDSDVTSIPWQMNSVHSGMVSLHNKLNPQPSSPDSIVHMANAIWAEQSYPLASSFKQNLNQFYKTDGVFEVDFRRNSPGAIKQINHWADEQTHHRIKEIVDEFMVDPSTRIVLTNAIYFKGKWAEPFEKSRTRDQDFQLADGSTAKTPMMSGKKEDIRFAAFNGDGSYFDTPTMTGDHALKPDKDGFLMIEQPYKGDDLTMVAFLPMRHDGLDEMVKTLAKKEFDQWFNHLVKRDVYVDLPKFKHNSEYDFIGHLQKLGIKNAFFMDADFSGLTSSQDAKDQLFITFVVQKAIIEMNEKGTEAAAVTALGAGGAISEIRPYTPIFSADHPFLYFIIEKETKAILFMGQITNPKKFKPEDNNVEPDAEQRTVEPNN